MNNYNALMEAHRGLAMLATLFTLAWLVITFTARREAATARHLSVSQRVAYIGTMAVTGLAGVTGLGLVYIGSWSGTLFPWTGLVAVALHGFAGVRARKSLVAGKGRAASLFAIFQIAMLVAAYGLMTVKPF
jgi:hypothetical protein